MRWGKTVNNFHDQYGPLHILKDDNSLRCGAPYYTTTGDLPEDSGPKCGNCERIERSIREREKKQAEKEDRKRLKAVLR